MLHLKKLLILTFLLIPSITVNANGYVETQKDTRYIVDEIEIKEVDLSEYELLHENENFEFYFRDDRDILALYDKRNGYTWKSGLDIDFSKDIKNICDEAYENENLTEEERLAICVPIEDRLNTTYTGIANSLVTIEYFDSTLKIKRISSASYSGAESEITKLSDTKYELNIDYSSVSIEMTAYIYLTDEGFDIEIPDESITGTGVENLSTIMLNPFMGASGGQEEYWNPEDEKYDIPVVKEMIDGYVLVPDGSGALIRFTDYSESLEEYVGDVYGEDYSQATYNTFLEGSNVPFKEPTMPVYGIAHGYRQAAFLGYASSGDEYMQIMVSPEENMTYYTWAYPKFIYNELYYQVYNQQGAGYFSVFSERNHFDIYMNYEFLSGNGEEGYPADYVGMALSYRDYLQSIDVLEIETEDEEIPARVDFIMSDAKEGIFSYTNVVMTTTEEVDGILTSIINDGVNNLSVGLLGWQRQGVTLQDPYKASFSWRIGTRSEFEELFNKYSDIDISLVEEYVEIADGQLNMRNNSVKHVNLRYVSYTKDWVEIQDFTYASPIKSVEWLEEQASRLDELAESSYSYQGIGDVLISDYKTEITVTDAINLYSDYFATLNNEVNIYSANQYLWEYMDRYLDVPMFSTSHLIETDTVPFLQLVLSDSIDLFGPYVNFSFNKQEDILRMVDYNVSPSILLTEESAHKMASTNSGEFYSTSYSNYSSTLTRVYEGVSEALNEVSDGTWIDREVIAPGVVKNSYDNGKVIIINYTESNFGYLGETVQSESYRVYG